MLTGDRGRLQCFDAADPWFTWARVRWDITGPGLSRDGLAFVAPRLLART